MKKHLCFWVPYHCSQDSNPWYYTCCSCLYHWHWHETAVEHTWSWKQPWQKALVRSSPPEKSAAGQQLNPSILLRTVTCCCHLGFSWLLWLPYREQVRLPELQHLSWCGGSFLFSLQSGKVIIPLGELQYKITGYFLSQTRHSIIFCVLIHR